MTKKDADDNIFSYNYFILYKIQEPFEVEIRGRAYEYMWVR